MQLDYKGLIDQQVGVVRDLSKELDDTALDAKGIIDAQRALSLTLGNLTKLQKMQRCEGIDDEDEDAETVALLERARQQAQKVKDGKAEGGTG